MLQNDSGGLSVRAQDDVGRERKSAYGVHCDEF